MEEEIYIDVYRYRYFIFISTGIMKERRKEKAAINGGVGGRSLVILKLSYAGKRLAARISDNNLTVNRLIIAY